MRLLLDTTVLIDVLRGRSAADRVRALRDAATPPWICAINVEEVVRGVLRDEEAVVLRFLKGMRLVPVGVLSVRWRGVGAETMHGGESPSARPVA